MRFYHLRILVLFILFVSLHFYAVPSVQAQITFTKPPTASLKDGKINISFDVSTSTDVEVAILDKDGKIVRHLAAGVLGGPSNPPAPLSAGLSQSLTWNGTDDLGKPVPQGSYTVRVRLGVRPEFERSISTKVFPASINMGPGNVSSTGDLISMSHPVWIYASSGDGTLHSLTTRLDMTISDQTDEIFLQGFSGCVTGKAIVLARFNGKTPQPGFLPPVVHHCQLLRGPDLWILMRVCANNQHYNTPQPVCPPCKPVRPLHALGRRNREGHC